MNKNRQFISSALLLMYLTSTIWVSFFHVHAHPTNEHADDIVLSELSTSDIHFEIENDLCISCQFFTNQDFVQSYLQDGDVSVARADIKQAPFRYIDNSRYAISDRAPPISSIL